MIYQILLLVVVVRDEATWLCNMHILFIMQFVRIQRSRDNYCVVALHKRMIDIDVNADITWTKNDREMWKK